MFGQECWYFLKSFHKCTLFYKKNNSYLLYTIKKVKISYQKLVFIVLVEIASKEQFTKSYYLYVIFWISWSYYMHC